MEQELLGIVPVFWKDEAQENDPNVLPFCSSHPPRG